MVLDKAQHIADLASPFCQGRGHIHAKHDPGQIGRPVTLLAGGLGTTEMAFESLGVSRIEDDLRV
ncbi:MAG: hypothetical protein OXF06_06890, partial [Bacteroidetes bacterium]|nr:hypothetical protein [Bacteroidota bacterium]